VRNVEISITREQWVSTFLPGLGLDRSRLIEVTFPAGLGETNHAHDYDRALRALREGRYDDCVADTRDIVARWNSVLGASATKHIGEVIGDLRGWGDGDPRRAFVTSSWKALLDICNVAHHQDIGKEQQFDRATASFVLAEAALFSQILSQ
jgi:hypothetical protein